MTLEIKNIAIATGGSGGHVIPAEVLFHSLESKGFCCFLMGFNLTKNPYLEKKSNLKIFDVEAHPFIFRSIHRFIPITLKGLFQAIKLLKKNKIKCVVGFGSYHSFPVIAAAYILKIPYVLYEANTSFGKVIGLFEKNAKVVASPFEISKVDSNFHQVSPLIRKFQKDLNSIDPYEYFSLDPAKKTLLVVGGSQGAFYLNHVLKSLLIKTVDPSLWQIIHLCGSKQSPDEIMQDYKRAGFKCSVKTYESQMELTYKIASGCFARSGATTLFELDHYKTPAFLIPLPSSSLDHQVKNAMVFADHTRAIYCHETELDAEKINQALMFFSSHMKNQDPFFKRSQFIEDKVLDLCFKT